MNVIKTVGLAAVTVALLAGCGIKGEFPGYEKSPTGLYSKFYVSNEGARKPKMGEYVIIKMKYYSADDSIRFNSSDIKQADNGFITQPVLASPFKASFEEALMSMAEGDSASFKISADSVYIKRFGLKELPKYIQKGSMLTFYVKMSKVKTEQELVNEMNSKESKQRELFLKQNNITVEPTETGLYFIETAPGAGPVIKAGQKVKVKYTGKFVNGQIFDASDLHEGKAPIEFVVGQGQVIPGWDQALQKMKKGGKAMLVIPSSLGYGSQGNRGIPPFSTLVFDLEVVDFK